MYPQRQGVTGKPVQLAYPPKLLVGREDLLAELEARLTGGGDPGPRVVVLSGLGGAGKTSVALAYARRHLAEVGLAWQFAAGDPTVLADEFAKLAAQLGALDAIGDARDPVASVQGTLAAFPGRWLLIMDNAPSWAAVERFVPPAGSGWVLITSRNAKWPPGQVLEVPMLGTGVAADFLVSRTGDPDRQAAAELATELGGLPLALEQAAAYIQDSENSLGSYLESFRRRRPEMLARGEPTGYPSTVAATWSLAFEKLELSAPQAVGLLRLLAFCAPEAIPLRLLLQTRRGLAKGLRRPVVKVLNRLEDPLAADEAVAKLRGYSLLTVAGDRAVSVHRLVQAVTADQMPARLAQAWQQAAAAVVEAAIPRDPRQPQTWPVFAALLPHAQAVLGLTSDGMSRMADYLGASGNYPAARDLFQLIVAAYRDDDIYDPKHLNALAARYRLAGFTGMAGDPAAARDQFAALLPLQERVFGPEDPNTLTTRHSLAAFTGMAGDPAAARDQLAALLPLQEKVFGPEHANILISRHQLGQWTGLAGDAAAARDQLAALLPLQEKVCGPEDPGTLNTQRSLARWTGEAGDPAAARDQFAALLPLQEKVCGPEHPDTLDARGGLARWTGEAGDPAAARDQFAALLPLQEKVCGPEHPDTLDTRGGLARWTGEAGDPAAARDQCAALLLLVERACGPEHPDTLDTRGGLARWTGEAGDPAAARDQCAALLPLVERARGPEHPRTLATRDGLAYWTEKAEGRTDPSAE